MEDGHGKVQWCIMSRNRDLREHELTGLGDLGDISGLVPWEAIRIVIWRVMGEAARRRRIYSIVES